MADFFCQPALPVPLTFWDDFAAEAFAEFDDAAGIALRARILRRLNVCVGVASHSTSPLPVALARHKSADPGFDELESKRTQLDLANHLLFVCSAS